MVELGAAVVLVVISGSLMGAAVGLAFGAVMVELGAAVVLVVISGSLMGAAVGLALGAVMVLLGAMVGLAPTVLSGATVGFDRTVGPIVPTGRPRCARPTVVRRPISIPHMSIFFIQCPPLGVLTSSEATAARHENQSGEFRRIEGKIAVGGKVNLLKYLRW
jgi:hypothetical protein